MASDWIGLLAMMVVATIIPLSLLFASKILRPSVPEKQKEITYESGEQPTGDTRIRFNIQYYLVALMFVVFDIETVLLLPWVVTITDNPESYIPAFIFIFILTVVLGWAWRNGAMNWLNPVEMEKEDALKQQKEASQ